MNNDQKARRLEEMAANREADLAEKLGLSELQEQKAVTIAMADADAALLASAQASDAIIARIKEERRLQDRKWGGSTYDDKHSLGDWAHLIDQRTATLYRAPEHKVAKQELIEVAALAIAALESLWRNREGK